MLARLSYIFILVMLVLLTIQSCTPAPNLNLKTEVE